MPDVQQKSPAEVYEEYFVPAMFLPWSRLLLDSAAIVAGERVLDVACGTGVVARGAAPRTGPSGRVAGLDMNPAMLGVARSRSTGSAIEWVQGSAQSLPFADGSFDVALCQHGLQFFPDRTLALREMRRVLAPAGRTLVMVLQSLERHPVFEALMTSVAHRLGLPLEPVAVPFLLADQAELRALMAAAAYERIDVLPVSAEMHFADAARFVPMAVASSAAAVPAFGQLDGPQRATLMDQVRADTAPVVARHTRDGQVVFTMHAWIARGVCSALP